MDEAQFPALNSDSSNVLPVQTPSRTAADVVARTQPMNIPQPQEPPKPKKGNSKFQQSDFPILTASSDNSGTETAQPTSPKEKEKKPQQPSSNMDYSGAVTGKPIKKPKKDGKKPKKPTVLYRYGVKSAKTPCEREC